MDWASIRSYAGKKPFSIRQTFTKTALSVFYDSLLVPSQDQTVIVTQYVWVITAGTCTGDMGINLFDNNYAYRIAMQRGPTVNIFYQGAINIGLETPMFVRMEGTPATQPFTYYVYLHGFYHKKGEGTGD